MDENDVTKILLVRGFATKLTYDARNDLIGADDYLHLKLFIEGIRNDKAGRYKVTYFDYGPIDDLTSVYDRLCNIAPKYDILIGHSLGGGLLAKYRNQNKVPKKVILLMPILFRNDTFNLINQFLFGPSLALNPRLVFLKALFAPAQYIFEGGNILNSDFSMISYRQPYDFYKEFKEKNSESDYLEFFKCNENVTMFYAKGELLNTIDEVILTEIETTGKLIRVEGLHECWRSIDVNTIDFYTKLEEAIKKDIVPWVDPPGQS